MKFRSSVATLLAVGAWLLATSAFAQEPRLVVLDFAGKGGDKARIQVIRALRDKASFETQSTARKVLASKGLSASTVAGRAAVANELALDYVVWGSVRGRGSSARAKIRFAGPKGKEIASREAGPPGTSQGNARIQKATMGLLGKAVAKAPPRSAQQKKSEAPASAAVVAVAAAPATAAAEAPAKASKQVADEPEPIEIRVQASKQSYAPYLTLLAGAGGRTRKISVHVDDGAGGTATREYASGIYLDIVFRLELRPLAQHSIRGLRGFVLEADGDFGIGLETQPPGSSSKLDTKAWRVLGQLGYFHRFEHGELGGLIGIGFDRLQIEANSTIPSIDYLFLRLGPAYRHFFIDRLLQLRVDAGFRYPFSYGELADTFGDAKGFGFDAGLMLGGELEVGFSYGARLSFDYFKPQFSGFPGGSLPPLPGAAMGRDATDLGINFHAMLGWSF